MSTRAVARLSFVSLATVVGLLAAVVGVACRSDGQRALRSQHCGCSGNEGSQAGAGRHWRRQRERRRGREWCERSQRPGAQAIAATGSVGGASGVSANLRQRQRIGRSHGRKRQRRYERRGWQQQPTRVRGLRLPGLRRLRERQARRTVDAGRRQLRRRQRQGRDHARRARPIRRRTCPASTWERRRSDSHHREARASIKRT